MKFSPFPRRRPSRRFYLGLACALLGVGVLLPTVFMKADDPTPPTPPKVPYWHVYTDDHGVSHQTRGELSVFELKSIEPPAAPQWQNRQPGEGTAIVVTVQPVGWVGEWHENPKPQWIIPLSGRWFVETMDGHRVEMGPGEVSFGEDQNTKPDAKGHKGHLSGTVGNEPSVTMIIQLKEAPTVNEPARFK